MNVGQNNEICNYDENMNVGQINEIYNCDAIAMQLQLGQINEIFNLLLICLNTFYLKIKQILFYQIHYRSKNNIV